MPSARCGTGARWTLTKRPWQCLAVSVRDPNAPELRAVAPLVALGDPPRFVAPITLIANGTRVIGVTSAEILRTIPGAHLAVTHLDGSIAATVVHWNVGRDADVGLVDSRARSMATSCR